MANANTQLFGYELQLSSNLMKLTHFLQHNLREE